MNGTVSPVSIPGSKQSIISPKQPPYGQSARTKALRPQAKAQDAEAMLVGDETIVVGGIVRCSWSSVPWIPDQAARPRHIMAVFAYLRHANHASSGSSERALVPPCSGKDNPRMKARCLGWGRLEWDRDAKNPPRRRI